MENEPGREESSEGINLTHEIQLEAERSDGISLVSVDVSAAAEPARGTEDEEENVANTNEKCFTADSLETIRSGESVFKLFTFDPEKCTANVDKCMAFWKKINEMDLKPVNCSLYKPKKEEPQKETCEFDEGGEEAIAEEMESEVGTQGTKANIDDMQISWCEALNELKKRNLDKVARVAKPLRCKMCKALALDLDYEQDRQDNEHEDIVALNNWNPQKMKKTQKKLAQEDGEERLSSKSVSCKNAAREIKEVPKENVVAATKDKTNRKVELDVKQPVVNTKDEEIKQSKTEVEVKIKEPVVKTKDEAIKPSKTEEVDAKIKKPAVETKDEEIKQSKTEVVQVTIKPPVVKTKDEEIKQSKTEVEAKIKKPVVKTKDEAVIIKESKTGEDELKIKESDVETKTASEEKTKTEDIDSESKTSESLDLMENLLKDVLAKMSEEIDAHVNVKELVNEIIDTAVQKIKAKKHEQLKTQIPTPKRKEEKQYKIPPYSMTGDYPCVCNEFDCKCAAQTLKSTVEEIKSARVEENRILIKQLQKISISTQFPELPEKIITSAAGIKGGFCKICGLCECICRYIQENGETDFFVNTSSNC